MSSLCKFSRVHARRSARCLFARFDVGTQRDEEERVYEYASLFSKTVINSGVSEYTQKRGDGKKKRALCGTYINQLVTSPIMGGYTLFVCSLCVCVCVSCVQRRI